MDDISAVSLHIKEIKNTDELNEIADEWAELFEAAPDTAPFQSPSWLITWWKYFGNGRLWTIAVYNRRILVGIAPLYIFNYSGQNNILRQLTFIGTGNTDYMDILCRPEFESQSVQMILEFLTGSKDEWDVCDFQELRDFSLLLKIKLPEEFEINIISSGVCPVAVLPESVNEYISRLPVSFRKNTLRARRRLWDSGTLRLETAKEGNLEEYIDWLFRLHNARWNNRNMPGLLGENSLQNFHKDAAAKMFHSGILRLYVLRHNGKIIASVYSLIKNEKLYNYIGGFDPDLAKFSPGSVILLDIIEKAISEGIKEFDFLRGEEDYKYKWTTEERHNYRMLIKKKKNFPE
ncbi:MAG TPA: GNAT family N-acetyltransferase [Ignavibacteriales bacterium]|nr:GNAT family N-acetyltransferase [Ignavibacteriales bacterium]